MLRADILGWARTHHSAYARATMNAAPIALLVAIGLATAAANGAATAQADAAPAGGYHVKIAPQPLGAALQELARQGGVQIIFFSRLTEELTTEGLEGNYTLPEAMERLLADSGLTFRQLSERTFEVRRMSRAERRAAAQTTAAPGSIEDSEISQKGMPEILVTGARETLNLDIQRTEDDVLPYVVFDREQIQQSGASSMEELLKYKLPMNALQQTYSQNVGSVFGARSQVDMRGFGTSQTLILIDGRRTSRSVVAGVLQQQDLNNIALGAVERIEVLPTSASGIYGGDATGGVVNIVLRRDFHGVEMAVGYDNVFDGNDRKGKAALTAGFSLEDGKTDVLMTAFWAKGKVLRLQDRDFIRRYRDQAFANMPALWQPPVAPPLGYTTNVLATEGNLTLDNGAALDSPFTSVPVGYAGAASDGGAALLANAGRYNFDLANSGQLPGGDSGGRVGLLSSPSLESINLTVRRKFGARVQAFLDASSSSSIGFTTFNGLTNRFTLPAAAVNNPFQQDIVVNVPVLSRDFVNQPETRDRRLVAGVISKLPWDWQGELDYVWSKSGTHLFAPGFISPDVATAISGAVRNDPEFNPLRDTNIYPLDISPYATDLFYGPFETTAEDLTLLLGGPVGSLPGGRPGFSVRLEYRDEHFGGGTFKRGAGSAPVTTYPAKSQTVSSVVAELRIPLVSSSNSLMLAQELELQLSGRLDEYRTVGSQRQISSSSPAPVTTATSQLRSTNPMFGLRWKPVEDVMLRASHGTGFLPPNVTQLAPSAPEPEPQPSTLIDPRRGNLPIGSIVTVQTGGNPELAPEESKSTSAGVIFTPRWLEGLRLSIDFTKIDRTGRIASHPFGQQGQINDEAVFPGRIVRGTPTPAEAAMGWAGPITFVNVSLLNIATAKTEAHDVQLDYSLATAEAGAFEFYAVGTWNRHNLTQTKSDQPAVDNVGFSGGVLGYKVNAGVIWKRRQLTLGWNTEYFDSYLPYVARAVPLTPAQIESRAQLVQIQGSARVDHQMYHDAFATYRFEQVSSEFNVGIRNVFNTRPPRDQQSYSTYGDPRLASYYIGFRKSFE
jgi:iron complex outermembrane recepter protein